MKKSILLIITCLLINLSIIGQTNYIYFDYSGNLDFRNIRLKNLEYFSPSENKFVFDTISYGSNNFGISYRKNFVKSFFFNTGFLNKNSKFEINTVNKGDTIFLSEYQYYTGNFLIGYYTQNRKKTKFYISGGICYNFTEKYREYKTINYGTGVYEYDEWGDLYEVRQTDNYGIINEIRPFLTKKYLTEFQPCFEAGFILEGKYLFIELSLLNQPDIFRISPYLNLLHNTKTYIKIGFKF